MGQNSLIVKALVLTAVGSYFAYALYWFVKTIPWIVTISLNLNIISQQLVSVSLTLTAYPWRI